MDFFTLGLRYVVRCLHCLASSRSVFAHIDCAMPEKQIESECQKAKTEAVAAWNLRVVREGSDALSGPLVFSEDTLLDR